MSGGGFSNPPRAAGEIPPGNTFRIACARAADPANAVRLNLRLRKGFV